MKHCPSCQTDYEDESLRFCLHDGTVLVDRSISHLPTDVFGEAETVVGHRNAEAETVVRRQEAPPDFEKSRVTQVRTRQPEPRKSKLLIAALISVLAILVILGGIAGALVMSRGWSSEYGGSSNADTGTGDGRGVPGQIPNAGKSPAITNTGARTTTGTTGSTTDMGGIQFVGCFKDTIAFDLDGYLERSRTNTPQSCIAKCRELGFKYAGVQYSESCLCGNSYGKYGLADNCNMKCTGDGNQICGGYSSNSVYAIETMQACDRLLGPNLYAKWMEMGGEAGKLGCPVTDETDAERSPAGTTGRMAEFRKGDGGYLILHGSGRFSETAFEVSGCMFKIYASLGGTKSWLGFPTGDEYAASPGARQEFEGGYILWDQRTYNCRAYNNN